jgi:hypothetical protein
MVSFAPDPMQQLKRCVLEMGEGNPGAITVLLQIPSSIGVIEALTLYDQMKEMGIVGSKVWLAYKDASRENLYTMIQSIRSNDARMIEVINRSVEPGQQARLRE